MGGAHEKKIPRGRLPQTRKKRKKYFGKILPLTPTACKLHDHTTHAALGRSPSALLLAASLSPRSAPSLHRANQLPAKQPRF